MYKQNIIPGKQGVPYKLRLGQNQGPFLAKDVSPWVNKSVALLSGLQVMNTFTSLNSTLKTLSQSSVIVDNTVTNSESTASFHSQAQVIEQSIQTAVNLSKSLQKEIKTLKIQIADLSVSFEQQQNLVLGQCLPILKGFMKTVREASSAQKQYYFDVGRQLNEIEESKVNIVKNLVNFERRIINLEEAMGSI